MIGQNAKRHEVVALGLEFEEDQQVVPAAPETDLPEQVHLALNQTAADPVGGKGLERVEVELVGQIFAHEVADQFIDCRALGEDELVGLVVLAGQSGLRPGCSGGGQRALGRARGCPSPEVSGCPRGASMVKWDGCQVAGGRASA